MLAMTTLSERLAALTHGDREADIAVNRLLWPEREDYEFHSARWTLDINTVVAEIERRGWAWSTGNSSPHPWGEVWRTGGHNRHVFAPTPCLALLRALVAAVETEK